MYHKKFLGGRKLLFRFSRDFGFKRISAIVYNIFPCLDLFPNRVLKELSGVAFPIILDLPYWTMI